MNSPLISVVIPVYNGEKYISDTLDTIINQDYKNIEVILVNDGSTDNSSNILSGYVQKNSFVRVYDQENKGVASARNLGIKKSQGQFISFCDQDDFWHHEKISKQIKLFDDEDIGLVHTAAYFRYLSAENPRTVVTSHLLRGHIFEQLIEKNTITCCSVMVRKTVFNKVGFFDPDNVIMGVDDWHMWLKVAMHYKVDFLSEPLCTHVFHGDNYSLNAIKMYAAEIACIEKIKGLSSQYNVNWEEINYKINRGYAAIHVNNSCFDHATTAYKEAYIIKPSAELRLLILTYKFIPNYFLLLAQKIKRKLNI
mgnify:CR=1 FL=1